MRKIYAKNINGDLKIELGSDVSFISEVIERGKCVDYLIFELEVNGIELIELMEKYNINKALINEIKSNDLYIITAFDW